MSKKSEAKRDKENIKKKSKVLKTDRNLKKITSFFARIQPIQTIHPEIQCEEMEWEEHANFLIDMEVDPHDWLKVERSRYRAIRLRRASCQDQL